MNLEKTAKEIVAAVGEAENILHLTHCMTRLRFSLKDEKRVDLKTAEAIEGVMGTIKNQGEFQIIIGTHVDQVYREIKEKYLSDKQDIKETGKKKGFVSQALDLVSATLSPLVPAIMGAGFISILLALLNQFGILTAESTTYSLLNGIANCVYYFFPGADCPVFGIEAESQSDICSCCGLFSAVSGFHQSFFQHSGSRYTAYLFCRAGFSCDLFQTDYSDFLFCISSEIY